MTWTIASLYWAHLVVAPFANLMIICVGWILLQSEAWGIMGNEASISGIQSDSNMEDNETVSARSMLCLQGEF